MSYRNLKTLFLLGYVSLLNGRCELSMASEAAAHVDNSGPFVYVELDNSQFESRDYLIRKFAKMESLLSDSNLTRTYMWSEIEGENDPNLRFRKLRLGAFVANEFPFHYRTLEERQLIIAGYADELLKRASKLISALDQSEDNEYIEENRPKIILIYSEGLRYSVAAYELLRKMLCAASYDKEIHAPLFLARAKITHEHYHAFDMWLTHLQSKFVHIAVTMALAGNADHWAKFCRSLGSMPTAIANLVRVGRLDRHQVMAVRLMTGPTARSVKARSEELEDSYITTFAHLYQDKRPSSLACVELPEPKRPKRE